MPQTSPFLEISPTEWVASNDLAFAIRDGFPVSPGHTLVIPRRQFSGWFEATPKERDAIFALVDLVKSNLDVELAPDGYNIGINVGAAAGQTVFHLHVHMIPRYDGDMPDPRGGVRHVIPWKGNYRRDTMAALSTGRSDHFIDHLAPLLAESESIDVVAAFVQDTGLELLDARLQSALARDARIRLLCGDYLHLTQERALRRLLDFQAVTQAEADEGSLGGSFEARVLETGTWAASFHPKSWVFEGPAGGTAFVGSSNISRLALQHGVEWNLRVEQHRDPAAFDEIQKAFELHWDKATQLTSGWIDAYALRAKDRMQDLPLGDTDFAGLPPAEPHELQQRALDALAMARQQGRERAMTVMATGLGKTWLSAFDIANFAAETGRMPHVLFIAHRAEILRQAARTYRRIFPDVTFGWFAGNAASSDADFVFASVQKLSRPGNLDSLDLARFDYVVVDEVHHATADSYRRVLERLDARFVLGLTATPERADGDDVLALFDDYLAEEIGIAEGIEGKFLAPFRYIGVKDTVDFEPIPWRSGKFDTTALVEAVQTEERMDRLSEVLTERPGSRTVVFCCTIEHALFVRDWLNDRGHRAAAITSRAGDDRQQTLDRLTSGELEFVCAVDILNEGVDIPTIDRVVMLRPTESCVVFLQQLGRGLRVAEGKEALQVIDFVGNHRIFLERLRWLLSVGVPDRVVSLEAVLNDKDLGLPDGCSIELEFEAKQLLRDLLPKSSRSAIVNAYRELREARGQRPSVGELFRMGHKPSTLRGKHGGWFGFVRDEGDLRLNNEQYDRLRGWFEEIETTAMTKCFKMVVVKVLMDSDVLFTGLPIDVLAERSYELLLRSPELFDDIRGVKALGDARQVDKSTWLAYWRKNPIAAWIGGDFFALQDECFNFLLRSDVEPEVVEMTRELVDYRLALYRATKRGTFYANVIHNPSGAPILMFGNRGKDSSIPEGEVLIAIDGNAWTFRFVKIAVNVANEPGSATNALPTLLRSWFGEDAGNPGTRHRVRFERAGDDWMARPIGAPPATATERLVAAALGDEYGTAVLAHARALLARAESQHAARQWATSNLSYKPAAIESALSWVHENYSPS